VPTRYRLLLEAHYIATSSQITLMLSKPRGRTRCGAQDATAAFDTPVAGFLRIAAPPNAS
jgi:hypothetical protein